MSDTGVIQNIWRSRIILLTGFSLVGVGAVVGAGSVYYFYIRRKLHEIFEIQSSLNSQLQLLKKDVDKVSQKQENGTVGGTPSTVKGTPSTYTASNTGAGVKPKEPAKANKKTVKFKNGYETADEDEYVTASSDSDVELDVTTVHAVHLDIPVGAEAWVVEFLKETDRQLDGDASLQHEAYMRLQNFKDKLDKSCGFWWRFAKATHMEATAAGQVGDSEMQKSLTFAAIARSERALYLNNGSANAHKWYAITLGSKGDYVSINEKIKNGFTFKEHVDKAVKINPDDPNLHYLLGRFCLEVSNLGWVERKMAAALFSAPPTATAQEALEHFQAAERLGKPLKDNRLYMAKAHISLKNNVLAAHWLKLATEMPNVSSSDKPIHDEAVKLYSKYKSYLNK